MKFLLFQAGLILLALNIACAQGSLSGTITDPSSTPLADVNIYIESLGRGTTSDKLGRFSLKNISPETYEVTVSSDGYQRLEDLNGYHGWMIDGYYNGSQQVFIMNVVDPDYTDINLYVWVAYNKKSYDTALEVLKSFTPN